MIKYYFTLLILILITKSAFTRENSREIELDSKKLEMITKSSAGWIINNQQSDDGANFTYFKGEWPSYMVHEASFILLGKKGSKTYDSNNFTVSNIFNLLAELYLSHPAKYPTLKPALRTAMNNILLYYSNESFNFWPLLPKTEKLLDRRDNPSNELLVHRPNNYKLKSKFINKAANIVNDADDTAISYIALDYFKKLFPQEKLTKDFPEKIAPLFDAYRDQNRKKIHFYNAINGIGTSHAYLTWLDHEAPFYRPWEKLPKEDRQYVPFRTNDVDCVVNTNILSALAAYGEIETSEGAEKACKFVNKMVAKKNKISKCGVYYPNKYTLHYTTAKAYRMGAKCLEPSQLIIHQKLIQNQETNGSFHSDWIGDEVQSTAYALLSLFEIDPTLKLKDSKNMAERAIKYLLQEIKVDENGTYWRGGVFFSGGTLVRKSLVWQSPAYTTAQILTSIQKYLDYLAGKHD